MLKDFGMNILVILWLLFCGVIDYLKIFFVYLKRDYLCFGRKSYWSYCFSYVVRSEEFTHKIVYIFSHFRVAT